ncbi:MAG: hypothetical protein ACRC46_10840 [Thermoguttaceae bacterium]
MQRLALTLLTILVCGIAVSAETTPDVSSRDIFQDTWVGTDALGRTMPTHTEVGDVKTDHPRVVGIFYISWHEGGFVNRPPHKFEGDVTRILQDDPNARLDGNHANWQPPLGSYHWGEPEMGYFRSDDEYVIRKDLAMLTDAGVDVLILDVTNAVCYWEMWDALFRTMEKVKAEGNRIPQFCFWSFNGPAITVVQNLYDRIYKEGKYRDLWFYWDGKPLLLYNGSPSHDANRGGITHPNPHYDAAAATDPNHPHHGDAKYTEQFFTDYPQEIKDFFTLRTMWWGYYKWGNERFVGTEDKWSFGYDMHDPNVKSLKPDQLVSRHNGEQEEAAVTPAQHPSSLVGKSWSRKSGQPQLNEYDMPVPTYVPWLDKTVDNPEGYGIYFQERWDEALQTDPKFLYLNDWNEWTAGKYNDPATLAGMNFMRRGKDASYFFVDQYNAEFNRGIQPMRGGYTDNYYMQMAQNIRRYKGARPIPKNHGETKIDTASPFAAWDAIETEYRDTAGDVFHRDHAGYGTARYVDNSGRNDIFTSKVAVDEKYVWFFVETAQPLTPSSDPNWMLLLIDADSDSETGWHGYDFLVNKRVASGSKTSLMEWDAAQNDWTDVTEIAYRVDGNRLLIPVPRGRCGFTGDAIQFDFKWSDNAPNLDDPISLSLGGDTAPNRRFNYRFIWNRETKE